MSELTPFQKVITEAMGINAKNQSEWTEALGRALETTRLKEDEKEKIGDMLVEFFESEMAVDDLIAVVIKLNPVTLDDAKDDLFPFIPARRKMEFLEKHLVLDKKSSHLFQRLHDQRNRLAD